MTSINSKSAMREAIQNIAVGPDRGRNISREEARTVMSGILEGDIDDVQVAVFLIALRMKRESIDEFLGIFDALQASVETLTAPVPELFCLADPFDGYVRSVTMTPFIAPVLAACGCPALMHGVESVGPKHGITAHKVYRLAGIHVDLSTADARQMLVANGWVYIDQAQYAPLFNGLSGLRDQIVKRTAITTLERLLMPIKAQTATHFVLGYVHKAYPSIYAKIAFEAGYDTTLLLKGVEGGLAPALNKPLRRFFFDRDLPQNIDEEKELLQSEVLFASSSAAHALDTDRYVSDQQCVEHCLELGLEVLNGQASTARDSLCLAAGQILYAHKRADSLSQAVENVQYCLDNGSAKERFLRSAE